MNLSYTFADKTLAATTAAGLIALSVPLVTVAAPPPPPPPPYTISGSASISGMVVNLSGLSAADPQTGANSGQHMAVDWDEDQDADPETGTGWEVAPAGSLAFSPIFFGGNTNNADGFDATWSGSHDYTSAGSGTYNVLVMVYHGNTPGQDGDAQASIPFEVNIPLTQCNDGVDNADPEDTLADFGSDPGCADGADNDETDAVVPNTPPTANDDSYSTSEDVALIVAAPGVLTNDTDSDNDPLTATHVAGPANGILVFGADGSFTYTPNANWNGSDSFTYKVNDGTIDSSVATVSLTVTAVNDNPTANDDAASVAEDSSGNTIFVLTNDNSAPDSGELLFVMSLTPASNGSVENNGDSVSYTPDADFVGEDTFTYTISDSNGGAASATVTVTVGAENDVPNAVADNYSTDEDTVLTLVAPGVLGNDTDADNDSLLAELVDDVINGVLSLSSDGAFTYTPNANWSGIETFTYKANDGTALSGEAVVTITINNVPEVCGDEADNDGDGFTDYPADPGCTDSEDNDESPINIFGCTDETANNYDPEATNDDDSCTYDEPVDVCDNLEGNQETVPEGYSESEGVCTPIEEPVDVCDNLEGDQSEVPQGYTESDGVCTPIETEPTDVCSNIEGNQESVPEGYSVNDGICTEDEEPPSNPPTSPFECSDGIDNDNDGRIDYPLDNSCFDGQDDSESDSGGFIPVNTGGGGGGSVLGASTGPVGQVLGESCGIYMDQYLRKGSKKNRADQVSKLQEILNKWQNAGLPVTGVFGPLTEAAVKAFQKQHAAAVLAPWNIDAPTGLVYLTTARQINLLECPELTLALPTLVPWSQNPNVQ